MNLTGTFKFLGETESIDLSSVDLSLLKPDPTLKSEDKLVAWKIYDSISKSRLVPFPLTNQEIHHLSTCKYENWMEYLVYRYKFVRYPEEHVVADFPIHLLIEPTSVCNLRCVMCFQVDKSFTKPPYMGTMDIELFRDIVDQAELGGSKGITLASRGEPTLHKDFAKMVRYVSGKFLEVKITTNATKLSDSLIRAILDSDVNIVVFSVDGHTAELYESIRVRGKFDQVKRNISRFHEIRAKEYPASKCLSRISAVYFRDDQQPEEFVKFWADIVDQVGIKRAAARWDTYNNPLSVSDEGPCGYLWERMYVWYDGTTNPCDVDYKSMLTPGSLKEKSIREIWHGAKMSRIRSDHLNGGRNAHQPCDRCGVKYKQMTNKTNNDN